MENQQSVTTLTHQEFRNQSNDVLLKFTKSVINLETEIGQNSNAEPAASQGPTNPSYIMEPPLGVNDYASTDRDANLEQRFKKPCSDNLATKRQRNVDNEFPKPSFLEDTIGKKNILENESSTACNIQLSRVYFSQKDQHENCIMQETKDMEPKVDTGRHRQRHLYYPELSQGNSYKIADITTQDAFYHLDSPVKTSQNKKNSKRMLLIDAPLKNYRYFLSGSEDWEKGSASLERIQEDKNDNDFEQDSRFLSDEEDFDICDNNEKVEETSTNMNKPSRGDSKDACEMRVVVDSNGRIMVINRDDDQPLNKTPRLTIKQYGKKRKDQTQFLTNEEQENKRQGPYSTPNQTKQYVNKKEDSGNGAKQLQDDHQRLPRRSEEHFVLAGEDGKHAFYYVSSQEDSKCKLYPLHDNCYIDHRQTEPPFVLTPSEKMQRFINKHGSNHLNEHEQQAQSFDTSSKEPFIDNRKYEKQQCPVHSNTHLQQLWSHGGLEAPTMVSHSKQVTDERPNELHIDYSNKYRNKNLECPIHSKISRDSVNNNHFEQKRAPCPIHGRINFDKSSRLNYFVSQELSPAPFDERRAKCPIHGTKASEQHFINSSSERERSYSKVPQQLSSVPFDERRANCPIHGTKASVDDSEKSEKVNNAIHSKMTQEQMLVPVENKNKRRCPIHSTDLTVVPSLQETNENLSKTNSDENIGNDMQISNEESEKPGTLEKSREKENDGNKYRCDWPACTKAFRHYSFLVLHRRIHTGERPYYCSWKGCNKQFRRSDDYQRHYRVHTGVKPYPCSICGKAFKRSDHRLFHYRAIHGMYMPKSKP